MESHYENRPRLRQNDSKIFKRQVLGSITNFRVDDPTRSKPGGDGIDEKFSIHGDENGHLKFQSKKESKPFIIYEDKEDQCSNKYNGTSNIQGITLVKNQQVKKEIKIHSHVLQPVKVEKLCLGQIAAGCNDVDVSMSETLGESPMVLDTSYSTSSNISCRLDAELMYDVEEYTRDIYTCLLQSELQHRPKINYIQKQHDITSSMRCILVDWLVEVAEEYKLHTETLYLAVSCIDRFLSVMSVLRAKLQLVGTAAMLIASKYEEIYPPEVAEFVYITDNTYTKRQVLRMEYLILKVLSYDLTVPTAYQFLTRFVRLWHLPQEVEYCAMYLSELTLLDVDTYLKYLPSIIACSAICLANLTLGHHPWDETYTQDSNYSLDDLQECVSLLHITHKSANCHPQQAIPEKYKHNKWLSASLIKPTDSLPW